MQAFFFAFLFNSSGLYLAFRSSKISIKQNHQEGQLVIINNPTRPCVQGRRQ